MGRRGQGDHRGDRASSPRRRIAGTFHHVEDDGKTQVYLWLCDVPYFHPTLDGATPEETRGAAWFRRKEIGDLDLAPKFREDWEKGSACGSMSPSPCPGG